MSPRAQRIAVAEACPTVFHIRRQTGQIVPRASDGTEHPRPSYDPLIDLNAAHDMEKMLMPSQRNLYMIHLEEICQNTLLTFELVHATAAQRVEAFLRTLGKWEDDK